MAENIDTQLPSEFYSAGLSDRTQYEDRAKVLAKLTVPYLIREDGDTGTTVMNDGHSQSYGGQLVNTLKAKMGMALLPPSTSSFRLVPKPEELEALTQGSAENRAKIYSVLSSTVSRINLSMEAQQIRNTLFDLLAQLIVVGSVVVEKRPKKGIALHTLQSFVVKLDNAGLPVKICFVETLYSLPDGVTVNEEKDEYQIYTMATLDKDGGEKWTVIQEIDGIIVGTEQTYKNYDELPFRYLGWIFMQGDQYHRPYAEDYHKDLEQLDKLAKLLTDGAIVAAKILLFVNQRGGRTRKDDVAESVNGDVIDGDAADVTTLKTEKNFDFQVPMEREQGIKKQLASAFLMNESVTRDAERVTAEEIAFMAKELESSSLSGIYSKLALQWSKWIIVQEMKEQGMKFDSISIEVITGLDALGRSQEAQKLDNLLRRADALGLRHYFKDDELLNRYAAFESIDTTGLLYTPNEVQEKMKAQQEQAIMANGEEAMMTSAGQAAGQAIVPQQGQQPTQN